MLARIAALLAWSWIPLLVVAQHRLENASTVHTSPADLAIKRFQLAPGLKAELFAAEPLLANPVAIHLDDQGRCFVVETHRLLRGVPDIRGRRGWPSQEVLQKLPPSTLENLDEILLVEDLALRTVEERVAYFRKWKGSEAASMEKNSEALRLVVDTNGDGRADRSTVFATHFNTLADGIASGVISRGPRVWFANIPHLWLLEDSNGDGVSDRRESLHHGFGVRTGFLGHDLHGLIFGPDGRLYFSIGDRGSSIRPAQGKPIELPDTGAVFRCEPDGSHLEVFHSGLRNPQELAFDEHGNLFTGDNNSDGGDEARIVHLVFGGDSGWRIGWQFLERPNARGPWNSERMWQPQNASQPAYILPPITNITSGPSGFAFNPGTGLGPSETGRFYLADFRGASANSGVHSFQLKSRGASFELTDHQRPIWGVLVTDVCFGPDSALYLSDWLEGWEMTAKGRVYRIQDPRQSTNRWVAETRQRLNQGVADLDWARLGELLAHPDYRIRQAAQFEWADRLAPIKGPSRTGPEARAALERMALESADPFARLHALWALGQTARRGLPVQKTIRAALQDRDEWIRAQAAQALGDIAASTVALENPGEVSTLLIRQLQDASAHARRQAAHALGNVGNAAAVPPLLAMLESNRDADPYLRHAAVMGLAGIQDREALRAAARHASISVRMGALLAMRRLRMPELAEFLRDASPKLVLEAARAIHDTPMPELATRLADLISRRLDSAPLVRRVLAANFQLGGPSHAQALAQFAAASAHADSWRTEALEMLALWSKPPQRDPVHGLWRPLAPRSAQVAADALAPHALDLIQRASMSVRIAAMETAGQLGISSVKDTLREVAVDPNRDHTMRVAALRGLAALKTPDAGSVLAGALKDSDERVRLEATRLISRTGPAALPELLSMIQRGALAEKQAAITALGAIPGAESDQALLALLQQLIEKQVDAALAVEILEAAEARMSSPATAEMLAQYKGSFAQADELGDYRVALHGGNKVHGMRVFKESEAASCVRCHKLAGVGGDAAPALDGIGGRFGREYLLESIVLPNKVIAEGYENVIVSLKNGSSYAGVLKRETPEELEINSPEDGLVTLKKSDLTGREKGSSGMLPDIAKVLTKRELRDLVEFLSSLK